MRSSSLNLEMKEARLVLLFLRGDPAKMAGLTELTERVSESESVATQIHRLHAKRGARPAENFWS